MKRKRSRFRRWAIRTAIALAVVAAILHLPVPAKMTISPETTVVTGPLNADGTVNYVDALNEMMSEGITPANNAAVLLVGAFGRGAWPERTRAELFRRLGIDALPAEGEYLVSVEAREKAHPGQPLSEQYDAATSRPWTPDELPHAAAWLAENQRPLDLMVAAAGRPRCYLPLLSNATPPRMIDAQLTSGGHLRLGVLALIARARLRAGQGKLQAAWSDILALHRLSRLMRDEPAVVLHLLRRGIERLAVEGGIELAADPRLTGAQAKRMLADLKSLPKGADLAEVVDCGERFRMLDVFMMIRRGVDIDAMEVSPEDPPPKPRRWFEADEALRVANDWYDRLVEALRQPTYASRSRLHRQAADLQGGEGRLRALQPRA